MPGYEPTAVVGFPDAGAAKPGKPLLPGQRWRRIGIAATGEQVGHAEPEER